MAITINRRANVDGDNLYEYDLKGLSTDTKPTQIGGQDIEDNSLFLELDTGDFYYLSGGTWVKVGEAPIPPTPSETVIFEDSTNNNGYFNKSNSVWEEALSPYMTNGLFNEGLDVRLQVNDSTYETLTVESAVMFSSEGEFASENYRIVVNAEDIYMTDQELNMIPNATIKIATF